MIAAALFAVGAVAAFVTARALGPVLRHPVLQRPNHRGARLPTAGGICLVVTVVAVEGARSAIDPSTSSPRLLVVLAAAGFGLLGLLDDLLGEAGGHGGDRGLRGHVAAALRGRFTTGFLKLSAGAALSVVVAAAAHGGSVARTLADGALIALAANLANLFDRAPGRTIKWALLAYLPLAWTMGAGAVGTAAAPAAGAAVGLLPGDVRERFMLGDTGANALGGVLGTVAVLGLGGDARLIVLAVLAALNVLSEAVSFSRVIAAVPPLRAFDRLGRLAIVVGVVVVALGSTAAPAGAQSDGRRVLIVSLPGLTWAEVADASLPELDALLEEGAVAAMAPRSVRHGSRPGDAYLTIGAGARSIGDPTTDGAVLPPDADFAGEPAGDVFQRRTGDAPVGAALALSWPVIERLNARQPYDASLGLLAETLRRAGVATAVIGNADGSDVAALSRERQSALALVDPVGRLAAGVVDDRLLVRAPHRPFGVRLDEEQVLGAFDEVWPASGSAAVLVEASDLARAVRYRSLVDRDQYERMRAEALQDADALLAGLLERVDPARDAVLVVAPYSFASRSDLTVVGLRSADTAAGYLRSASSQRAGMVTLVDVAPTILDLLDLDRPVEMEGRAMRAERSGSSLAARADRLAEVNAASRFRENLLTPTTIVAVLALAATIAGAVVTVVERRPRRWRDVVAFGALAVLSLLPLSFLVRAFPIERLGLGFYWSVVGGGAVALAAVATAAGRRWRQDGVALAAVLGVLAGVLVGDAIGGSDLHLSSAFGYSPTGNSRLYGISNYSFGMLAVAICMLAALVAHWWPTRRGQVGAVGLMIAALVVLGVPTWGADVGGILAFTPAILVFGTLVLGRRPSVRVLVAAGLATAVALAVFGLVDLARPASERAHLGRLLERVGDEGPGPLLTIIDRKLMANIGVTTSSFWVAAIPLAIGVWLFLRGWGERPLRALHRRVPTLLAGLAAAVVAAVLGSLVNDSGVIVGGVAALVLAAALVNLTMAADT